jgi:hypothetical protein
LENRLQAFRLDQLSLLELDLLARSLFELLSSRLVVGTSKCALLLCPEIFILISYELTNRIKNKLEPCFLKVMRDIEFDLGFICVECAS